MEDERIMQQIENYIAQLTYDEKLELLIYVELLSEEQKTGKDCGANEYAFKILYSSRKEAGYSEEEAIEFARKYIKL